jgi:hypothetical protein
MTTFRSGDVRRLTFETALSVVVGVVGLLWFFRVFLITGFDGIYGDQGDVRFVIAILEHWVQLFQGKAQWLSPSFFYPVKHTLGYSDTLFLMAAPYSLARSLGFDAFIAFQMTMVFMWGLGYVGATLYLRRGVGIDIGPASLGAAIFMFSNAQFLAANHPQLAATAFVPWLAWMAVSYWRRRHGPAGPRYAIGAGFMLLLGGLTYTAFYIAWFTVFGGVCLGLIALGLMSWDRGREPLLAAARWLWGNRLHIVVMLLIGAATLVPFVLTYKPVIDTFPLRGYPEIAPHLPQLIDYINVDYSNRIWGGWLRWIDPELTTRDKWTELRYGFTPGLIALFLAACVAAVIRFRRRQSIDAAGAGPVLFGVALGAAVLLVWLLMLHVGDASLWKAVYKVFPAAGAVRAVFRFNLVLALAAITLILLVLQRFSARGRWAYALSVGVLVLVVAEQHNVQMAYFSKAEQRAILANVKPAPEYCRVFAILPNTGRRVDWRIQQIDAMLIAMRDKIKTINGYSGYVAPGAWPLHDPFGKEYSVGINNWVQQNKLKDVCGLDFVSGQWRRFSAFAASKNDGKRWPIIHGSGEPEPNPSYPWR